MLSAYHNIVFCHMFSRYRTLNKWNITSKNSKIDRHQIYYLNVYRWFLNNKEIKEILSFCSVKFFALNLKVIKMFVFECYYIF